jgi:nucleotide sugar dehydrogenase
MDLTHHRGELDLAVILNMKPTSWSLHRALPPTPPDEEESGNVFDAGHAESLQCTILGSAQYRIAVIGVGYVGLHLVETFAQKYSVVAFDLSAKRLESLQDRFSSFPDILSTTDARQLRNSTHFLIAVPTTLRHDRSIDLSYLKAAIKTVADNAGSGATIIIESSVAVGTTRALLEPLMQLRNWKGGMSPERVDPGRTEPPAASIPKVISGLDDITPGSLESIHEIYSQVFHNVLRVSKPEVAEMMKLYENCQRMICIAYANELADACTPHDIDPYEVCNAAATKPFGYIPFSPGLGVGGPCIPCNP